MENIKSELAKMETVPLYTGHKALFLVHKLNIQNELFMLLSNPPAGFEAQIAKVERNWRYLGSSEGTLQGYNSAIAELKTLVSQIEATQLEIF